MTKQEIEKAIENEDIVYIYNIDRNSFGEIHEEKLDKTYLNVLDALYNDWFFKTKAEAEHYLNHANITRTVTLPFVTWEEFKSGNELFFTNKSGYPMCLCIVDTKLGKKIGLGGANGYFDLQQYWDLTEENFYKAYDECVRLFKGEE